MQTFKKLSDNELSDPIGPGSRAWHHADLAAIHFAAGRRSAFFNAQCRMIAALRSHGQNNATIEVWKRDIRDFAPEE